MQYGGRTDVRTHNKIVPLYTLVWGSFRLAPITGSKTTPDLVILADVLRSDDNVARPVHLCVCVCVCVKFSILYFTWPFILVHNFIN